MNLASAHLGGGVLTTHEVGQCGASALSPRHQGMPVNPQMYVEIGEVQNRMVCRGAVPRAEATQLEKAWDRRC